MGEYRVRLRLVLVSPEGRINLGFILRLSKNFGIEELCIVNPGFNIRDREVLEFAAKASDYIDRVKVVDSLNKCLSGVTVSVCTTAKLGIEGDVLRQGVSVYELNHYLPCEGVIALVFGRESTGLTREELKLCDIISTINTGESYNVFNLSHAVAIYLYELSRLRKECVIRKSRYCHGYTLEVIKSLINEIGKKIDYERGALALKHALMRSCLTVEECTAIYRLLKRLKYRLDSQGE